MQNAYVDLRRYINYEYAAKSKYVEVRGFCFRGFRCTTAVMETKRNENLDKLAGEDDQ